MTTECRVGALGVERRECDRPRSGRLDVPLLLIATILALVLIGGIAVLNVPLRGTMPEAGTGTMVGDVTGVAAERGASFEFLDHELEHAGGYVLRPSVRVGLTIGDASDPVQATSLDAQRVGARTFGTSPLAGPEYWIARSRPTAARVAAVESNSPLAGPEYWVSQSRSAMARVAEVESISPLAGPEYWVARLRLATPRVAGVKSNSPLAGPEYLFGRSQEGAACTAWSETLARFHEAKRVEDPVNGASSAAEAAFYIAKYGAGNPSLVALEGGLRGSICGT